MKNAAAKVGGIYANNAFPADFIYDNLAIEANIIHSAHLAGVDLAYAVQSLRAGRQFRSDDKSRPARLHS
jgi:NAD-dependent epimerase/dehydratase family protein